MDRIRQQFKDIADMIRLRNGTTDSISASEMPELIRTLSGGTFTANSIVNGDGKTQTLAINTYKAPMIIKSILSENSLEALKYVSEEIAAKNMSYTSIYNTYGWSVGDVYNFPRADGTTFAARIIDFNKTPKADGSGNAGITFEVVETIGSYQMHYYGSDPGSWTGTTLRNEVLRGTIWSSYTDELKSSIVEVLNDSTYTDTLFVLGRYEMSCWSGTIYDTSKAYKYYKDNPYPSMRWTRDRKSWGSTEGYFYSNNNGSTSTEKWSSSRPVFYAFCI